MEMKRALNRSTFIERLTFVDEMTHDSGRKRIMNEDYFDFVV